MPELTLANISKLLTEDIIDKVFQYKTNSDDNVKSVKVSRATPAGEGLISAVYRIKLTGAKYETTIIAKCLAQDPLLRTSLNSNIYFEREVVFIKQILPVLIENQKSLGATESIQNNIPEFYSCYIDGLNDYILMEDLYQKGCIPVSAEPTKLEQNNALKALAHFHSLSLALRVKKPQVFKEITVELNEIYYHEGNREWYAKYLKSAIDIDKKVVAEIEGKNGYYNKKFEGFLKDDVYGQLIELTSTRGDHPVINHGDAWYSNFLCSYDKGIIIDFQMVRSTSLATDLSYFICLCCNQNTRKEDFYESIELYYNALEFYLKDMGLDVKEVFSFDILKEELRKYGKYGMLAALTSIPLIFSERCDTLQSFGEKYAERDKIALEELWPLTPITSEDRKLQLVNTVRVAVDVGLF